MLADGVIVCDKAFDTAPFVHLPPAGGLNDFFALDCKDFIDRDGNHHASLQGGLCQSLDGQPNDDALGHAFAIYEVTLCGETNPDGPCGTTGSPGDVWAFARFAVIDEKNVLLPFTNRAAEGAISAKQADGTFELTPSLPIRVALGAPKVKTAKDDGTSIYAIDLSIDNLTSGATSAGGTCLPSLASAGAADPFGTSTNVSLALYRVPSMHAPGDDEGVIEFFVDGASRGTDMATSWFVGPAAMIATTAPPPPSAYDGFGHGTPGSVMNLDLDLVTGGGGACTP